MGERALRTWWRTFDVAFAPIMRHRLRVRLSEPLPSVLAGPLVLVANHVSWWDGFLLRAVQRALRPSAALRTIALEAELVRHSFLRRIGGIGVDPAVPSSILHALRAVERLRSDDLVLGYFPQGRITASHARPLAFQRGIDLVLRMLEPATVVPIALHIEPLTHFAPTALVAVGTPLDASATDHTELERHVAHLLDDLLAFTAAHGEDTDHAWSDFRVSDAPPAPLGFTRPRLIC